MALDTVEIYLPTFKLVYGVDDIPTKVSVVDSTDYAYIGVLKYNLYPFNLVDVPSFRDFPPIGWSADPEWYRTYIVEEGNFIFLGVINTKTPATGSYSLTSGLLDLSYTDGPTPDTFRYTYSLTHMEDTDTLYIEIKKASDGPTCWAPVDTITSAEVTTDTTTVSVQIPPASFTYSCGTITDNDTIVLRFRFADNSSVALDSTAYFALYKMYMTGNKYRPTPSDTLSDAQVAEYAGIVKAAFNGVPDALLSFMGVDRSVLKTKRDDKKVLILIAPLNSSLATDVDDVEDKKLRVGYWDMYDTLNTIDVIYINTAQGYANEMFGPSWDTSAVRRYLAFQYARLIAYSLDTTEAFTWYPSYLSQFNVAAKAAWMAHKTLKSSFSDPYGLIQGFRNDPPRVSDPLYVLTLTYEGRPQYAHGIAKSLVWLLNVEEMAGETDIKDAIREQDVIFLYDPIYPSSVDNIITASGSGFYDAVKTFYLKMLGANTSWAGTISGYPRFTIDTLLNQISYGMYVPGLNKEQQLINGLAAIGFKMIPASATDAVFDGKDNNRVVTYVGSVLDTIPGFWLLLVDTVSGTIDTISLDARLRARISDPGGLGKYRLLLVNLGGGTMYSLSLRDTNPPLIHDIGVLPSALAPEFVDVYVNIQTYPLAGDTTFYYAYYDVGSPGIKFAFWPAEDTERYDTLYAVLGYVGMIGGTTQVYHKSVQLHFTDLFGNLYYGRIKYRLLYAQNRSGIDYVVAPGVGDTVGEVYRIRLTPDMQEIVSGVLSMASLGGSKDVIIVPGKGGEYLFSAPVSAQVRYKAEEGDRLYVFNGHEWVEANYTYYPEEGLIEAFVNSAYGIYAGKDKPSGVSTAPANFSVKGYVGSVSVSVPKATSINLRIYNTMGRLVRTISYEAKTSGRFSFRLNDLPRGVYFVQVRAGSFHGIAKVVVIGGER